MKRTLVSLVVCMILALGIPMSAAAQESPVLDRIIESGELRVGMSGTQPPFAMKAKTGDLIGYEVELAEMLAIAMGVELVIVEIEFSELLPALKDGDVDVVMSGMTITTERNLQAAFIGPYIVSGKSMLTTAATLNGMGGNVDFNKSNLTLATLGNSTSQDFVEAMMPLAKLMIVRDYDEAVQAVLDGTANAMVADFPICALSQMRNPNMGLATLSEPLTMEPIGMALPPGDSLLLNVVENLLVRLTGMGVLASLETKWFDDGSWLSQLP